MGLVSAPSEVVTDGGWTWLQPAAQATGLRHHLLRQTGSKVGVSEIGLYLANGGNVVQYGWSAVTDITAVPAGRRVRIRIDDGYESRITRASFQAEPAHEWLLRVRASDPRPLS